MLCSELASKLGLLRRFVAGADVFSRQLYSSVMLGRGEKAEATGSNIVVDDCDFIGFLFCELRCWLNRAALFDGRMRFCGEWIEL